MNPLRKVIAAIALVASAATASSPAFALPKTCEPRTKVYYTWTYNSKGEKDGCIRYVERIDAFCFKHNSAQEIPLGRCRGRASS